MVSLILMDSRSILNLVAHNAKAKAAEFGGKFQSTKTVGKPSRNIA